MSELKESIQMNHRKRKEKLEQLRANKAARDKARQEAMSTLTSGASGSPSHTPRSLLSPKSGETGTLSGASSEVLLRSGKISLHPGRPQLSLRETPGVFLHPKPKVIFYERNVQVDIESESEEEEPVVEQNQAVQFDEEPEVEETAPVFVEMPAEELEAVLASEGFYSFLNKATPMMEEALDDEDNFFESYVHQSQDDNATQKGKLKIQQFLTFAEEERVVNALHWSPQDESLVMASYISKARSDMYPDGYIIGWDLNKEAPAVTFQGQSAIMEVCTSSADPFLVVGGTYGGQILIWDHRAKQLPVQRSPTMGNGHQYPITGLKTLNIEHSNSIVSMSQDGRVCTWSIGMMESPVVAFDVKLMHDPAAVCFELLKSDRYAIGTENGSIFFGDLSNAGEKPDTTINEHYCQVTSMHCHPTEDLLLSGSVDWTVQLHKLNGQEVLVLDNYADYVLDVKWNPANPSVFVSIDGEGLLDVWDLSKTLEAPFLRHQGGPSALTKVAWEPSGLRLAAGNSSSAVSIFKVNKETVAFSSDEHARFLKNLDLNR